MDDDHCYRVLTSRDGRFDGVFFTAVRTTGIYCRPSCPATTPKRQNVRFFATAAGAQESGYRACKRCRPDAAPGSPEWDSRADVVARAIRLISDGVVEREGVAGLASQLGYGGRQLHRLMHAELGTGPLRLARAHRVQRARMLLETTGMPVTDVAWASGFASVRQFNDTIREVYALSPTELRRRAGRSRGPLGSGPGTIKVSLAYRPPLDLGFMLDFLGRRAVRGVEEYAGGTYRRVLRLPHGLGVVSVGTGDRQAAAVECALDLDDVRDFSTAVSRVRRMLDLDADPLAVSRLFEGDPVLGHAVAASPGRRMPGSPDGPELAVRAVLGQQVSVASAKATAGRLVDALGEPLRQPSGALTRAFPSAEAIATSGDALESFGMPAARRATLRSLSEAISDEKIRLDPGADRDEAEAALRSVTGIGDWTASYVRMRALGDPDVFLTGDRALERALERAATAVGLDTTVTAAVDPERWHPWRTYAVAHLWATLSETTTKERT